MAPDTTNLVVPQDWLNESLPADRPFELEVVRDETTVRVSASGICSASETLVPPP